MKPSLIVLSASPPYMTDCISTEAIAQSVWSILAPEMTTLRDDSVIKLLNFTQLWATTLHMGVVKWCSGLKVLDFYSSDCLLTVLIAAGICTFRFGNCSNATSLTLKTKLLYVLHACHNACYTGLVYHARWLAALDGKQSAEPATPGGRYLSIGRDHAKTVLRWWFRIRRFRGLNDKQNHFLWSAAIELFLMKLGLWQQSTLNKAWRKSSEPAFRQRPIDAKRR
jgi:hypothetical protein